MAQFPGPGRSSMNSTMSRRKFLAAVGAAPLLAHFNLLSEPVKHRHKIRDIQCMVLSGERTYTLVKVIADSGINGIAEAYGSPSIGTKEERLKLKPLLIDKDPLGIDA